MPSVPRRARALAALGLLLPCLTGSLLLAANLVAPSQASDPEPLSSESFTTAKARAAREGKLLLVQFTATWCAPCRLMEETTFVEPRVLDYLAAHYVRIAVDVDDFDGFALKQRYEVTSLPTLLFLSSEGSEVGRLTESIGATDLLTQLETLNRPKHRRVVAVELETDSHVALESASDHSASGHAPESPGIDSVATPPALGGKLKGPPPEHAAPLEYVSPASAPDPLLATERAVPALAEATMTPTRARLFSLQAGVFPNRPDAVRAAEQLRDDSGEAVLLEFDYAGGRPVYRLYVGRFADLSAAEALRQRLEGSGYELIGRELAMW